MGLANGLGHQRVGLANLAVHERADAVDVARRLGQRARQLLDQRVTVQFQRVEIARPFNFILVAVDDLSKTITIAEIKLDKSRIRLEGLKHKSQGLLSNYKGYTPQWLALSLEDAADYL